MKFAPGRVEGMDVSFACFMGCMVIGFASLVSWAGFHIAWQSSEKQAAYTAYVECLRVMQKHPIDVQQTFCGKIREQL